MQPGQADAVATEGTPQPISAAGASAGFPWRDVLILLGFSWLARGIFMLIVPQAAHSADVDQWQVVARVLAQGGNPYRETSYLNWPPVWMQLIFAVDRAASILGISFLRALQCFLILVESLVIVVLLPVIRQAAPAANARKILLWGASLNPIAILLVVQHGNFDTLVALWLVLFAACLFRYRRTGEGTDWLAACLFLGLGAVTKTFPLVLTPLLAGGFRRSPPLPRFLGLFLLLGPLLLGLSIIYVLAPADVGAKVLAYRSFAGWFGITGLLALGGAGELISVWGTLFNLLLAAALVLATIAVWRRGGLPEGEVLLLAGLLLLSVPALGPGYAPQYFSWFIPFLLASFAAFPGRWRVVLTLFYAVAVCTYLVEYALFPSHGMFLTRLFPVEPLLSWSRTWSTRPGQILIRLPLFIAFVALLGTGFDLLRRRLSELRPR
jgi:hypothetical protein